jgi:tRNA 2-thiouridine synthesizing protein E
MVEQETVSPLGERMRCIAGKEVLFDKEGFFVDTRDWSAEIAIILSREMGMAAVSEKQWLVLHFLRDYYLSNGRGPLNAELKRGTGLSLMELESMFPEGISRSARILAGLPNPKSCMS